MTPSGVEYREMAAENELRHEVKPTMTLSGVEHEKQFKITDDMKSSEADNNAFGR